MKTQVVVNKADRTVICLEFANGKKHDFRLYKESKLHCNERIVQQTDTGYVGINKIHSNSVLPHKKTKKHPLTKQQKQDNRKISSERVPNENAIGFIKRFRILSERYRNRRKRFALRFNLVAGICNFELMC
jgi:hypothetical protein